MFENVAFQSEGATLRGRLYLGPHRLRSSNQEEGAQGAPIVVMAHGTSATITMVADRYAECLCEAGFAVLLYDHRNFGISDGEPRGEINPWVQARGYRDAIDYASSLPEIDKSRVAIWGLWANDAASGSRRNGVRRGKAHIREWKCEHSGCRNWPSAGGLIRSARRSFAAHANLGLSLVHRIWRTPRNEMGELGHARHSEHARALSSGHLRAAHQGSHPHDDCTGGRDGGRQSGRCASSIR
jgi:hypothetical protein